MNKQDSGDKTNKTPPSTTEAKIIPRKRTRRAPRKSPEGFEPLKTCPEKVRPRLQKKAAVAHKQAMKAVELKCMDCCAWYRTEAKLCEIKCCPLWAISNRIFNREV